MGIIVIQNDCEEVNSDYFIIFVFRNMSFLRKIIFFEENKFILMIQKINFQILLEDIFFFKINENFRNGVFD